MSIMKRLARIAAAAVLATGIATAVAAPSDAAAQAGQVNAGATIQMFDTGWG